ncbi:MAG: ATP-binding protein [Hyphomicrobiales bacterium]
MLRKLTIPKKLRLGFGVALAFIITASIVIVHLQYKNKKILDRVVTFYEPSQEFLYNLHHSIYETKMLIKSWVFIEYKQNTKNKEKLIKLHNITIPKLESQLAELSPYWTDKEQEIYNKTLIIINDTLFPQHLSIMDLLQSIDDYSDPIKSHKAMAMVKDDEDLVIITTNKILDNLNLLISNISKKFDEEKLYMETSYSFFSNLLVVLNISLLIITIIAGIGLSRLIVIPIYKLTKAARNISDGDFNVNVNINTGDEIELLGSTFNNMAENLKQQREKLEKSNATKDKFFSILAHELRAPFNAFLSVSEALAKNQDKLTEERKRSFANSIYASAYKINALLHNLLQWSCTQTNNITYIPKVIDANEVVNENIQLLSTPITNKKLNVNNLIPKDTFVWADYNLLSTVIRNLINNATKFTPSEGIINIILGIENNETLIISVQDTGIGLSQKDINKLFRIDVDTKFIGSSTEKGTGLGLILCKEFVEINGGRIWVTSEEGKGSTFSFSLQKYSVNKLNEDGKD